MFFTEKRYRSISIGFINNNTSNTIPLRVFLISESWCFGNSLRKFAVRWRVTTVQSLSTPLPTESYLTFCIKRDTKLLKMPNSRLLLSLSPFCRSLNCLPDQSSSLIPRPFRIERKLALTCLNTQITLQFKQHKQATQLIVATLIDINACNNNISNNNKREGRITSPLGR